MVNGSPTSASNVTVANGGVPLPTMAIATPPATAPPASDPTAPSAPASRSRYEWGPELSADYQPPAVAGVKPDVEVSLVLPTPEDVASGVLRFAVAAHDPAGETVPVAIHMLCYPPGHGRHSTADAAMASAAAGEIPSSSSAVSVADPAQATEVTLARPDAAKSNTKYKIRSVLEFAG